ncbi:hypothetical protein AAFF_G00283570 [Aldrovandia affinis]|uniref:Uncharacterized protein n=1 Tax=Aldrovandia affinis TaxID=143900 RepID=A0AAD7TA33_9TELE|nr:hypothetical protein AAFF_G00283570 [Aldrovandia affinis]
MLMQSDGSSEACRQKRAVRGGLWDNVGGFFPPIKPEAHQGPLACLLGPCQVLDTCKQKKSPVVLASASHHTVRGLLPSEPLADLHQGSIVKCKAPEEDCHCMGHKRGVEGE